jgi:hypothetical protein
MEVGRGARASKYRRGRRAAALAVTHAGAATAAAPAGA